jgi:hypothetical protein
VRISFREFLRMGVPTVTVSLLTASAWLVLYVLLGNRLAAPLSLVTAAVLWVAGRGAERVTR